MLVPGAAEGAAPVAAEAGTRCPWRPADLRDGLVRLDATHLARLLRQDDVNKYYLLDKEPLARGPFSEVRRCQHRNSGRQCVAKLSARWRCGDDCLREVQHEVALLAASRGCPRIVRLLEAFQHHDQVITILELAAGGDLQTVLDEDLVPLEEDVIKYVRQLLEGVCYLHERAIAHLDIKPQNLVLTAPFPAGDVKLCDFEVSRVVAPGAPAVRELLGTPDYVAPEILQYEPITTAADLWSVGVTTYVLLTGFTPFGGESDQETFCNVSRAQLDFPDELFDDVSADARDFIARLLVRDPRQRPSARECLSHRWLRRRGSNTTGTGTGVSKSEERPSLRKYLSRSREALYERVVQRYGGRLCTSQLSLACRRPRCGGSAEKLYGLRTLSRSHEGLLAAAAAAAAAAAVAAAAAAVGTESENNIQALQSPALILEQWANYRNESMQNNTNNNINDTLTTSTNQKEEEDANQEGETSFPEVKESSDSSVMEMDNGNVGAESKHCDEEEEKEEEPRFTVAQLISAFNRHDEAASKGCASSQTAGPLALRLFLETDNSTK